MNDAELTRIIEKTAEQTVIKLKMAGLMKDKKKSLKKMDELLRAYPTFKKSASKEKTAKLTTQVEKALASIKNDPYYDIIELYYFEKQSRDAIAEYYDTTGTTITRNKQKLLEKLALMIFSEDVIREIFLS